MTINTTPLRAFMGPVWHEISSLWSSVDFSFGDPAADSPEPSEPAFFSGTATNNPQFGISRGHYEHCWSGAPTVSMPG